MIYDNFYEDCEKYKEILHKFNQIHNITALKNIDEAIEDSIKPLEFLQIYPKIAIDIGSGGGFPAIFLAMNLRHTTWHLFEPNAKKSAFLSYVKVALNLDNIQIYSAKIERCAKFKADFITSRALMKIPDLLAISRGFYDENTTFLFYKGSNARDEISPNLQKNVRILNDNRRNYVFMDKIC